MSSVILPRTSGNILSCAVSKSVQTSVTQKRSISKKVSNILSDAMKVARDQNLDVPAGIQAIATKLIEG